MKFSVLMSVYIKETPAYLDECLASLGAQSLLPSEIIIVHDGVITDDLKNVISKYSVTLPIKSVKLAENRGLAEALNEGLKHCTNELVARMDTDDVSLPHRFERQIKFMVAHPRIAVSSAWIEERDQWMDEILFIKKLPSSHDDILRFSKRRNPISHPVSIFRKAAVVSVGAYPKIFPEDYALWSLMLLKGHRFENIPETLLYMRTGSDFIDRRGLNFFKGEWSLLKYQRTIGFLNNYEFLINFLIRAVIRLPPAKVRAFFYKFAR